MKSENERKSAKTSSASISYQSSDESVKSKKVYKESKVLREVRARRESHISQLSDFQTTSSSSSCDAGEETKAVRSKTIRREIKTDPRKSLDVSDRTDKTEAGSTDLEKDKSDSADMKIKRKTKKIIEKGRKSSSDTSDKDSETVKRKPTTCRDDRFPDSARSDDSSPERDAVSATRKDDQQSYSSDFDDDGHEASSIEEDLEKSDTEIKQDSDKEKEKGDTFTLRKKLSSGELSENVDTDKSGGETESKNTKSKDTHESISSHDVDKTVIEAWKDQGRPQDSKTLMTATSSPMEGSESETGTAVKLDNTSGMISDKRAVKRPL